MHRFFMDLSGFWRPSWQDFRPPGGVFGVLRGLLARLGGILRPLGGILGPHGRILVPLGLSWRHLGAVLGLKNPPDALDATTVAGSQGPLLRIP